MGNARLNFLCGLAAVLIVAAVYDGERRKAVAEAKRTEHAANQLALSKKNAEVREQSARLAVEERQRKHDAQLLAMTSEQVRAQRIESQFSLWDGSHPAVEAEIKRQMHNPDSYKHVETRYSDKGEGRGVAVHTTFRGTNAFGGVVASTAVADLDEGGQIIVLNIRAGAR